LPVDGIRYVVQKGDNLSKIAQKTKSKITDIKKANGLINNYIFVGQKLFIPGGEKIISKKKNVIKKKAVKRKQESKKRQARVYKKTNSPLSKIFIRPSKGRFTSGFGRR
jgi:LysM repeat protein